MRSTSSFAVLRAAHAPSNRLAPALLLGAGACLVAVLSAQLLLVRSSSDALVLPEGTSSVERFAAAWWLQLRWMLPGEEKPLRGVAVVRQAAHAPEGVERHLRAALTIPA